MRSSQQWLPRSIECLRGYTARQFTQDLIAGFTVGLVALPLAMAFAIASGVPPQAGLYTAVVAGFLKNAALVCGEVQRDWTETRCQIRDRLILLIANNSEDLPRPKRLYMKTVTL
jgi:hypothetical protein